MRLLVNALCCMFVLSCWPAIAVGKTKKVVIHDPARDRNIPVLVYEPAPGGVRRLVIFSHGKGIKHDEYSFIAEGLTELGYAVASIQHDLPGDPATPNTGNIPRDRTPGWKAQVQTILRVADVLAASRELSVRGKPILIGHSNGGDSSMMAARDFPQRFSTVMSLDNRRFALPRTKSPRICSFRSSDQKPDPGVLPMEDERTTFSIRISTAQNIRHDDMWDAASPTQRAQIMNAIQACLTP